MTTFPTDLAPIALFVYNRPEHTRKTLSALNANPEAAHSRLIVFCDGPKSTDSSENLEKIRQVREVVNTFQWLGHLEVREAPNNIGLRDSIRGGVDHIMANFEKVIVLEDDIVVSPGFLSFLNQALVAYENCERVMHVNAFLPYTRNQWILPETFFHPMLECWGWATWRRAWKLSKWNGPEIEQEIRARPSGIFHFNLQNAHPHFDDLVANNCGRLNTWAVFWASSIFLNNGLCLFPRRSLIENIGIDGSGVHFTHDAPHYRTPVAESIRLERHRPRFSRRGNFYLRSFLIYGLESTLIARLARLISSTRKYLGRIRRKFTSHFHANS